MNKEELIKILTEAFDSATLKRENYEDNFRIMKQAVRELEGGE